MSFLESCHILNTWISQSQGHPIPLPSGDVYSFTPGRRYADDEIKTFEQTWKIQLPNDYRHFLTTLGNANCFIERGAGFEFLPLEILDSYSARIFEGVNNPFPQLIIAVAITRRGEYAGFDLSRLAERQFTVFVPDIYPENWRSEASGWESFSTWLIRLIQSEGDSIYGW